MTHSNRFWRKVQKSETCWCWTASTGKSGYGRFFLDGRSQEAHRVAFELEVGPIPVGLQIDHLCRNRTCVRPDHLEAVTQQVNMARGEVGKENTDKTACPQGHAYTGGNLYIRPNGWRGCRECLRDGVRRYRASKREGITT